MAPRGKAGRPRATRARVAARGVEGAAGALMLVRAAHAVYSRWERLPPREGERLRAAADQVKQLALDLRGHLDPGPAGRELGQASRQLASGIMDAAAEDPRVSDSDLLALREDLAHELRRFADRSARKAA